jgi:hypothetical protein
VADSGLVNINLEHYYPTIDTLDFDIKNFLYMGLVLKEKEFRKSLEEYDWISHENQLTLVFCSAETILPSWTYMLIVTYLQKNSLAYHLGQKMDFIEYYYRTKITHLDLAPYEGQRVIVKGCSDKSIPITVYGYLVEKLLPVVKSIMFGEACSNVPIFKKKP